MKSLLRIIGIICLSASVSYWHPCETTIDWVMLILFWIGFVLFVDTE